MVWRVLKKKKEIFEENFEFGCSGTVEKVPAFPDSQKLLAHPNVWLADSAASIHMTPHQQGMHDIKKVDTRISLGDKSATISGHVGTIRGQVCDCFGNPRANVRLKEVAIMKSGFNLFSITKMQLKGWNLSGDTKGIYLKKGNNELRFDIPIST